MTETTPKAPKRNVRAEIVNTFVEQRVAGYLAAHEKVKQHPAYESLPGDMTQFHLSNKVGRQTTRIFEVNLPDVRSYASIKAVVRVLADHYFHAHGYAHVSTAGIADESGLNIDSVRKNLDYLMKSGLWAKVEGYAQMNSRYYPLFSEKGMEEFLKVVDIAKQGLDPLTGRKPGVLPQHKEWSETAADDSPEEEAVDMSPEAQETRVPEWGKQTETPAVESVLQEEPRTQEAPDYSSDDIPWSNDEPDEEHLPPDLEGGNSLPPSDYQNHNDYAYYSTPEGASL